MIELDEVGSTNTWMMTAAAGGAASGDWVLAHRQTEGRGRRGREWVSPSGNLYASTLVQVTENGPPITQLAFVAAVALDEALAGWVPTQRLSIKWPNDLLLDGKKLAGMLLERSRDTVIIGFGVNLVTHPDQVERPAISLASASVDAPSPKTLALALADAFARRLQGWHHEGFAPIRAAWLARAHPAGTRLIARLADGATVEGGFEAIDQDGALILHLADGARRVIHTADVFTL